MSRPVLNRSFIVSDAARSSANVQLPEAAQLMLPEKVVQFGTGALLHGLIDAQIDEAIRRGHYDGRVVAIGSTGSGRDQRINAQDGLFTLVVQGIDRGNPTRECRVVASVSRAISAIDNWSAVLACARNPCLEIVFSNTTEVGITFDPKDAESGDRRVPASFPGKLTAFLYERARTFAYEPDKGVVVIPCELIDDNGHQLRELVLRMARSWSLPQGFRVWIEQSVRFCNTLVDRIVPGTPPDAERDALLAELGYEDKLVITCEPYRLLVIEGDDVLQERLRFARREVGVVITGDIAPYRQRKVRLLNGGHTALVSLALLARCETVLDAVTHPALGAFVKSLLLDEIVPYLDVPGARSFAREVLERFANPHIRHQLRDIALYCGAKMRVRVVPSIVAHVERTGRAPDLISLGFAAYLLLARGDATLALPNDEVREELRRRWGAVKDERNIPGFVRCVTADAQLWGRDLDALDGFSSLVATQLAQLARDGAVATITARLGGQRNAPSQAIA